MRRARRRSILVTSGPGGIRIAARQIRALMNKSLTVLSAAKRFLVTSTSGESTSLGVFGCRGETTQVFQTQLLYSSYMSTCYFIQCTVIDAFLLASSLPWQPQGQVCFLVALLLKWPADCDHQDHYMYCHVLTLSLVQYNRSQHGARSCGQFPLECSGLHSWKPAPQLDQRRRTGSAVELW